MPARRSCAGGRVWTLRSRLWSSNLAASTNRSATVQWFLCRRVLFCPLGIGANPCIRDQRKLDWTPTLSSKTVFQAAWPGPVGNFSIAPTIRLTCLSVRTVVKVRSIHNGCIALAVHTRPMQDGYHLSATPYGGAVSSCSSCQTTNIMTLLGTIYYETIGIFMVFALAAVAVLVRRISVIWTGVAQIGRASCRERVW